MAAAAAGLSLLINQPIAHLIDRARPYLAHPQHAHVLIARSHDPSFPSAHATGAFALAFALWLYDRTLGTILLVLGAGLAFARVYVGPTTPATSPSARSSAWPSPPRCSCCPTPGD